jgi:hypothetical protein
LWLTEVDQRRIGKIGLRSIASDAGGDRPIERRSSESAYTSLCVAAERHHQPGTGLQAEVLCAQEVHLYCSSHLESRLVFPVRDSNDDARGVGSCHVPRDTVPALPQRLD